MSFVPEFTELHSGVALSEVSDSLMCSRIPKESFYNRMRIEIAELMESLDFSLLRVTRISAVAKKGHGKIPNFQLAKIDNYLQETSQKVEANPKKSYSSHEVLPRTFCSTSSSRQSSIRQPPAGGRLFKEFRRPVERDAATPQKTGKPKVPQSWIRIEDITEVPQGLFFEELCP